MTRRPYARLFVAIACTVAAVVSALAQTPSGTGEISGTLVRAGTATPIARAYVTISAQTLPKSLTVISDEQGRFTFRGLPSGVFTITGARPAYIASAYGAKRPGRPGTPVTLAAGQRVFDLVLPLAQGAAITGTIRDESGDPIAGIEVSVTPLTTQPPASAITTTTDDRGMYRAFGLPAGQYLMTTRPSGPASLPLGQMSDADIDALISNLQRRGRAAGPAGLPVPAAAPAGRGSSAPATPNFGFAPLYFPGTADPDEAAPIAVADGEERSGVDVTIRFIRTVAIEGQVSVADGTLPSTSLTLMRSGPRMRTNDVVISSSNSTRPDASGTFRFSTVTPGRYRLTARAFVTPPTFSAPAGPGAGGAVVTGGNGSFWGVADIVVTNTDISGLAIVLRPGMRVTGRVAFDARTLTPPASLTAVSLRLMETGGTPGSPAGFLRGDGTFDIGGVLPGEYVMTSPLSEQGWWLRSAMAGGRDVLDYPLELDGTDVSGVEVTFTDRHSILTGTLQTSSNLPAPEHFVIVVPADRSLWRRFSRRVQTTRPSTDGRFVFRDLPPGDYLLAALTDLEPNDLADAAFLGQVAAAGVPVRVADGAQTVQDLRIARP